MSASYNAKDAVIMSAALVQRAIAGEDIEVTENARPVMRMVPIKSQPTPRKSMGLLGVTYIADDFDDPLPPEILGYFTGENND